MDLSRNAKVTGDIGAFVLGHCERLVDLFLHATGVGGDYASIGKAHLPDLRVAFFQGTAVTGELLHLPGDPASRPTSSATQPKLGSGDQGGE
jgi:hypothetical protein